MRHMHAHHDVATVSRATDNSPAPIHGNAHGPRGRNAKASCVPVTFSASFPLISRASAVSRGPMGKTRPDVAGKCATSVFPWMRTLALAALVTLPLVDRSSAAEGGHCICSPEARPVCRVSDLVSSEPGFRCTATDGAVGRAIDIRDTTGLETIDLSGLNTTRGLRVSFNADLRSFVAPTLADSDGDVRLDFNSHLRTAQLPRLASVAGSLQVNLNVELEQIDLTSLEQTDGHLLITGDKLTLAGVKLDIQSTVDLRKFPPPLTLALATLARAGDTDANGTRVTVASSHHTRHAAQVPEHCVCPEQPVCTAADLHTPNGGPGGEAACRADDGGTIEHAVVVRGNAQLRSLNLSGVSGLPGGLDIGENFLLEWVGLPTLGSTGDIRVERNPVLVSVEGPQLSTVKGDLHFLTNEQLRSLDMPALTSVGGAVEVRENYALENLALTRLGTCVSSLHIGYNNHMVAADLGELRTVGGGLFVRDNFALQELRLGNLTNTADALLINGNDALKVTGTQLALAFELDLGSFPDPGR